MNSEKALRSLRVRPLLSADLSFNMPGIIDFRNLQTARLGSRVAKVDLRKTVYALLDARDATNGACVYDSTKLRSTMEKLGLFAVRNESLGAELDQAVAQRQNSFLEFYKHASDVEKLLGATLPKKVALLNDLGELSGRQRDALETKYKQRFGIADPSDPKEDPKGVSEPRVTSTSLGKIVTDVRSNGIGLQQRNYDVNIYDDDNDKEARHAIDAIVSKPTRWNGSDFVDNWGDPNDPQYLTQRTTTDYSQGGAATQDFYRQENVSQNEDYRHLVIENRSRHDRALIELGDERLATEIYNLRLKHMTQIWSNELSRIDLEVRKLQLNFTHTYLTSPIDGIVTAIYKDVGEGVQPGNPVLRVENADVVLLVGIVLHRGPLQVDPTIPVVLETADLYEAGKKLRIDGRLVAVRGHDAGSDEWDVVIECDNTLHKLPLNYHFDRDVTEIKFG